MSHLHYISITETKSFILSNNIHYSSPADDVYPSAHDGHDDTGVDAYVPATQSAHAVLETSYFPDKHARHTVNPVIQHFNREESSTDIRTVFGHRIIQRNGTFLASRRKEIILTRR